MILTGSRQLLESPEGANSFGPSDSPMKPQCAFLALTLMAAPLTSEAAVTIAALNTPYTENFDSLASSGTSSTVPLGWAFFETGSSTNLLYTAGTGSSTTGDTYSFGATGSGERAFGELTSGSLNSTIGVGFTNGTGQPIDSLLVGYTGEVWRLGATGRTDRLDFQISLDATSLTTGVWTNVDALDFLSPATTPTGQKDGNLAANRTVLSSSITGLSINDGSTFWLRWTSTDATGNDDGLAVDDFSLAARSSMQSVPEGGMGALMAALSAFGLLVFAGIARFQRARLRAAR